jgi:hypothetical protein
MGAIASPGASASEEQLEPMRTQRFTPTDADIGLQLSSLVWVLPYNRCIGANAPTAKRPSLISMCSVTCLTPIRQLGDHNLHLESHLPTSVQLVPSAIVGISATMELTPFRGLALGRTVSHCSPSKHEKASAHLCSNNPLHHPFRRCLPRRQQPTLGSSPLSLFGPL